MVQTLEIIRQLKKFKLERASRYGIKLMGIFGSYARGQQDDKCLYRLYGIGAVFSSETGTIAEFEVRE